MSIIVKYIDECIPHKKLCLNKNNNINTWSRIELNRIKFLNLFTYLYIFYRHLYR